MGVMKCSTIVLMVAPSTAGLVNCEVCEIKMLLGGTGDGRGHEDAVGDRDKDLEGAGFLEKNGENSTREREAPSSQSTWMGGSDVY